MTCQISRRAFAAGLALTVGLASGGFRWVNYGRDPFAQNYEEAMAKLASALGAFVRAGVIGNDVAQELYTRATRTSPRAGRIVAGDRFAMMLYGKAPVARRDVVASFSGGLVAKTHEWSVTRGGVTYVLVLPMQASYGGGPTAIEYCYNWAVKIVRVGQCFEFRVDPTTRKNDPVLASVLFQFFFWRGTMGKAELLADECLWAYDARHARRFKPAFCMGCPVPGYGLPDLVVKVPVVRRGYLSVPARYINVGLGGTDLLICAPDYDFRLPRTRAYEGYWFRERNWGMVAGSGADWRPIIFKE